MVYGDQSSNPSNTGNTSGGLYWNNPPSLNDLPNIIGRWEGKDGFRTVFLTIMENKLDFVKTDSREPGSEHDEWVGKFVNVWGSEAARIQFSFAVEKSISLKGTSGRSGNALLNYHPKTDTLEWENIRYVRANY